MKEKITMKTLYWPIMFYNKFSNKLSEKHKAFHLLQNRYAHTNYTNILSNGSILDIFDTLWNRLLQSIVKEQ